MDAPRKPHWPKIVATVVIFAVLYVASVGPANVVYEHLPDDLQPVCFMFYMPLTLLSDESKTAAEALNWYMHIWKYPRDRRR